ncbi:MAG: DUF2147 domain-containing protein [Burkholderiales bacterium]|jgi:uncharacterized protein (DUF2147 family)|nr:DUF2147 domain-containing protein [Burkholderiales bacterium]
MTKLVLGALTLLFALTAAAADPASPAGLWKTVDDKTKLPRSLVRISEVNGVYEGRIEQLLNRQPDDDPQGICRACPGDRKDKPLVGMTILSGLKKDGDIYTGGEILDPKNGKSYRCKMEVIEGGKKLNVRGFIGVSLIGRTQTWLREE